MNLVPAATPSTHRHWVGASTLLVLLCVLGISGVSAAALAEVFLRDGLLALVWAAACVGIGSSTLPRRAARRTEDSPALHLATSFAAGAGVLSLLTLGCGLAGVLGRPLAVAFVLAGCVAAGVRLWRLRNLPGRSVLSLSVSQWCWAWLIATPAVAVLIIAPAVLPGVLWGDEPNGYDVVSYHLQIPREWHDAGRITHLDHNVFSTFPFLTEMHYLLAMHLRGGAYAGMYLAQYMHAGFACFTSIAVYGLLGGRARPQAVVGGLFTLVTPWTVMVGTVAYNEAALMLYSALCFGWLWRAMTSVDCGEVPHCAARFVPALVGGAMGGLACGVKLTAGPMVVLLSAVAAMIVRPRCWRGILLMMLSAGVVASPWLVRNALWTGNPIFPQATQQFGGRNWSAGQQERWSAAHSPRDDQRTLGGRLTALANQVVTDWKFGFALLPAAAMAAGFSLLRQRGEARAWAWFLTVAIAGQCLFWLFATHLQGRFLVLAIPLLAMLAGSAAAVRPAAVAGLIAAGVCAISGIISFSSGSIDHDDPNGLLPQPLPRLLDPRMRACIGITNPAAFWSFVPEPIATAVQGTSRAVVLVGDAKAFWWPIEANRLHYRTVFDVDRQPGESLIDAWKRGGPSDALTIVDPNELRRVTRTYRALGNPPAEIADHAETYVDR